MSRPLLLCCLLASALGGRRMTKKLSRERLLSQIQCSASKRRPACMAVRCCLRLDQGEKFPSRTCKPEISQNDPQGLLRNL